MSKILQIAALIAVSSIALVDPPSASARERIHGSVVQTTIVKDAEVPPGGYATVDSAVIAASNRFNPDSIKRNREHVGAIVACNGAMFYTHGKGRPAVTPVRFSIAVPEGCSLRALWHTHGGRGRHRQFFSASDTETAEKLGVPFYLANYKGELRVFHPGKESAAERGAVLKKPGVSANAATGQMVLEGALAITVATR